MMLFEANNSKPMLICTHHHGNTLKLKMDIPTLHNKACNVKIQFYTGGLNDYFCEVI